MSQDGIRPERVEDARHGFFAMTVRRPVMMGVLFITLVLLGLIAYGRMSLQFLPGGLSGTRFSVMIPHPGSSAQENLENVSRILEEQFRTLPNLEEVASYSQSGSVRVRVKFSGDSDGDLAKAELRDRIERARPELPDTVNEIYVWANDDGDMPIMWFAIVAKDEGEDMDYLLESKVQRQLEAVDGVSRVSIFGLLNDSVRILLDEDKVMAARLDLGGLIRRLSSDNFAQPLGEVDDGGTHYLLRADMRFKDLDEIRAYPVADGLTIADIASVERVKSVRDWVTRINGGYAYYGMVQKESTANVVDVGRRLQAVMDGFEEDPALAGRLSAEVFFNQADFIENSLNQLKTTAVQGGGLALLVLLLFLRRARMTLCVALCIPVSALLALAFEYFRGGTFNVLTMTGLTLAIGMLVDNAVVVIENVARLRARGYNGRDAAVLGARDVGLAVTLATMTSVVVFLPLIFMGGQRMQVFLKAMGLPLCASLVFSLIVALVFMPTMAARVLGPQAAPARFIGRLVQPIARIPVRLLAFVIGGLSAAFHGLLVATHRVERIVLGIATPIRLLVVASLVALAFFGFREATAAAEVTGELEALGLPKSAWSSLRSAAPNAIGIGVLGVALALLGLPRWRRRPSAPPARPARFVPAGDSIVDWLISSNRALLAWTMKHRLLATALAFVALMSIVIPSSNSTLTAFGEDEDTSSLEFWIDLEDNFTLAESSREVQRYEEWLEPKREELGFSNLVARFDGGGANVEMRWDESQDPKDLDKLRERMRREIPRFAGHRVYFRGQDEISDASKQFVAFELRGPSAEKLQELGELAVGILEGVNGLTDVTSSVEEAPDQVLLELDDDAAFSYGVTSQSALRSLTWALRGQQLPRYHEAGREVPLFIEYDDTVSAGLDTVRDLTVFTEEGRVPLSTFSEMSFEPAPTRIVRRNGQISQTVTARIADPTRQGELVTSGYDALEGGLELPRGFSLGRDTSVIVQGQEELRDMQRAMMLSVVLVFLLMGILFESLLLPLSVLTTIPFAMLGAFWTLFVTGTPMDSIGWIGVIILVGVVVNNGIVLIDKIHRLRSEEGLQRSEAVLAGAAARVRPIVMTALTTVVGLLPMAMGDAPTQGIDYRALATCVAGGLALCTFFTLWVVPLAYTVIDDLSNMLAWLFRRTFAARGRSATATAGGLADRMTDA